MFQSHIKHPVTSGARKESTAAGSRVPHVAGSLVARRSGKERLPWHKTPCCCILTQAHDWTASHRYSEQLWGAPCLISTVDRWFDMHPQRPLPQAMPTSPSLGQTLRDAALGFGRGKNLLGGNIAYGFIQSLKECLYFLLCCWCIKEILD